MSLPSQTQHSQVGKTHETFCIRFCEQVERNCNQNATPSSPQYTGKINKIFTQMADETRWKKFGNFLKKKSELDEGDLLARFTTSWFNSLQNITHGCELHRLRMFLFVFDLMNGDTLKGKSLITLTATLITQVTYGRLLFSFVYSDFEFLCIHITENFYAPFIPWTGIASDIIKHLTEMNSSIFVVNEKSLNGYKYVDEFLLKLLDNVLVTGSFNSLTSLIGSCSLQTTLYEYTESLFNKELSAQIATKLIALLVWIPDELREKVLGHLISHLNESEDLFDLSNQLNEVFISNAGIARLAFNLLKKDRHLVTSRMFPLICQLLLCNIPRLHQSALIELKQSIGKLWKHCDKINDSAWMRSVTGECDIELLMNNFDKLITIISTQQKWLSIVEQPLHEVAFMLIDDKSKSQLRIANGRNNFKTRRDEMADLSLELSRRYESLLSSRIPIRIEGNAPVLMMGKRLLLTIAATKPIEIANLLDKIFQKLSVSTNHNSSLILIDVILNIVMEHTIHLLNSWKSLRRMVDAVCCFSEENGVLLVRALLPVIIQREQLVQLIVSRMRRYVLCETTSSTALPILLLLLRSSTIRSAIRNDQFTQSFATFSTQALQTMGINTTKGNSDVAIEIISILKRALSQPASTRSQLYKGIIEASYANENLVDGALDLLLTHLSTTPPISRDNYVESNKVSTVLLEPLPQLIQAVSVLVRLSIHSLRNTSTQVVSSKDAQVVAANSELDKFIEFARDRDVHDLEVDKLSDFSTSVTGRANVLFSTMLIALYDALIEHLWHVGNVLLQ
ncbi:unnamed protein product [Anisakis simplex]|uniref:FANCI_HD2 domain-containing protein n=1 Tax=Anisakis simplex TaxID=6269 RepID=A0A0M3KAC7_ANISI|nr:unnamed protein product [Anisakis simplex]